MAICKTVSPNGASSSSFLRLSFESLILSSIASMRNNKLSNIDYLKIPSGEITNLPYLKTAASFGKPLILSTGPIDESIRKSQAYDGDGAELR